MPPVSEIDDIFASKGKEKSTGLSVVTSTPPIPKKKSKSKKAKKSASTEQKPDTISSASTSSSASSSKKRAAPETLEFVDPSAKPQQSKRAKVDKAASLKTPAKSESSIDTQDHFNDSRGSTSRAKTSDGWSIYKEDELGLGSTAGGDTPLCPFDCDCCF